jgi:hypothetical protein
MAVLDQELGDLHRIQRAIGGVVAKAFASALTGMVPMYLLMSAFHSAPWLKLISSRRSGARRP